MESNLPRELAVWVQAAEQCVMRDGLGVLPLAKRIELWELFDQVFSTEWHYRRCALSFVVAHDTLSEWYASIPTQQVSLTEKAYPSEILEVARRVLLNRIDKAEARTIIIDKRLNLDYVRSDLPDGRDLTAHWAAAVCAMETVQNDVELEDERTLWPEILSGRVVEDDIEPAERDVHYFAAFQFAQPNMVQPPEELAAKYRIFWNSWLDTKVIRVLSASTGELREWIRNV
jgi:hypothetical protein